MTFGSLQNKLINYAKAHSGLKPNAFVFKSQDGIYYIDYDNGRASFSCKVYSGHAAWLKGITNIPNRIQDLVVRFARSGKGSLLTSFSLMVGQVSLSDVKSLIDHLVCRDIYVFNVPNHDSRHTFDWAVGTCKDFKGTLIYNFAQHYLDLDLGHFDLKSAFDFSLYFRRAFGHLSYDVSTPKFSIKASSKRMVPFSQYRSFVNGSELKADAHRIDKLLLNVSFSNEDEGKLVNLMNCNGYFIKVSHAHHQYVFKYSVPLSDYAHNFINLPYFNTAKFTVYYRVYRNGLGKWDYRRTIFINDKRLDSVGLQSLMMLRKSSAPYVYPKVAGWCHKQNKKGGLV